jgi:hypothetical protein
VSWDRHHSTSEKLATEATLASRAGNPELAQDLYKQAAREEAFALDALKADKHRTRGITAVSAVALWYKGRDYASAEELAHRSMASPDLPTFARAQLRNLLQAVWTTAAAESAGVRFVPGDVLVSVKGGEVIQGGAPLDLIVQRVEGIRSVLFRTVEMLLARPFRKRGGPPADIYSMFRPWLFQAPAGSYQFAVRMQEPEQTSLFEELRPKVSNVTSTFFSILQATTKESSDELELIVPDTDYRSAFLSLSRNLAPTGKSFERLEVREASSPSEPSVAFALETRETLNAAIRKLKPPRLATTSEEPTKITGILRAVHLDQDWIEIVSANNKEHIRIEDAGDALDDVVGPMVNRTVIVSTVRRGTKHLYRDIELDD